MKKIKKMMAFMLALVMCLSMTGMTVSAEVPTEGSITVNSPIIGAQYSAYKIFDMTTNENVDSFAYTIKNTSPFYNAVVAYAAMPASGEDANADGLTLTATNSDPTTFNVSVDKNKFDAQAFGKFINARLASSYVGDDKITDAEAKTPTYESGQTAVTVAKADAITFEHLDLGYYLITNKYPDTYNKEYTLTVPAYTDDAGTEHAEETITLTNESTDAEIKAAADKYVASQTTAAKVEAYINDPNGDGNTADSLKTAKYGAGNESQWTDKDTLDIKNQLENSYRASVEAKMNKIHGDEADYNVKEPVLVFVDSSQPNAVINEKNEIDKWDEPINPEGYAETENLPEHGEPKGGKNIVIKDATQTSPAIYADWTEANIGDKIHYQLSVNATNFERTGTDASSVKQIKEYIIADYQNANMTFSDGDKIMVSIVKKEANGTVSDDSPIATFDYTAWADKFFLNDGTYVPASDSDIFGTDKGGIVIPWIYEVTETSTPKNLSQLAEITNYTKTEEKLFEADGTTPKYKEAAADAEAGTYVEEDGKKYVIDAEGHKVQDTKDHYFASLYPNDVTILVDYYMTLDDTATIDEPGNKNISQFGVNFVEPNDSEYTTKPETPEDKKPSSKKTTDDAKVYTYALKIHKVDDEGKDLSGAKFKVKGLTATEKAAGWYKAASYSSTANDFTAATELSTDEKGNLVIEGLSTSAVLEIMETAAPEGFNKLEGTVTTNATKISETVTTSATTTYYDADGNKTGSSTVNNTKTTYFDAQGNELVNAPDQATLTNPESVVETNTNLTAVEFKVVNKKGTELPSTGGIGTTIFYVMGSILVICAGVVLVTRRRMAA